MKDGIIKKLLGGKKTLLILIAAAAAGFLLMLGSGGTKTETSDAIREYENAAANKIEQTVGAMRGGKVYVIVTAEYGPETQYAKNTTNGSEQTVLSSGRPVVVREASPVIRGITVICRNGDDPALCRKITSALSCAYGVSSARIYVTSIKYR